MHNFKSVELFCCLKYSVFSCACHIRNNSVIWKGFFCFYQVLLGASFSARLSLFSFDTLPYRESPFVQIYSDMIYYTGTKFSVKKFGCVAVTEVVCSWNVTAEGLLHLSAGCGVLMCFCMWYSSFTVQPSFISDEDLLTQSSGIYGLLFVGNTLYTRHRFKQNVKIEVLTLQWSVLGN